MAMVRWFGAAVLMAHATRGSAVVNVTSAAERPFVVQPVGVPVTVTQDSVAMFGGCFSSFLRPTAYIVSHAALKP